MSIFYGIDESEVTYCNVYRKAGHVVGVDEPVEQYVKVLEAVPFLVEPLNPVSLYTTSWNATHRLHTAFREDLRSEDRIVEIDTRSMETAVKYTVQHIQSYRPHHLELYVSLDSQPLVV